MLADPALAHDALKVICLLANALLIHAASKMDLSAADMVAAALDAARKSSVLYGE